MEELKLYEFIKMQRKRQNLSIQELADEIGISSYELENIEKGYEIPSFRLINKFCRSLKIDINNFLVYKQKQDDYLDFENEFNYDEFILSFQKQIKKNKCSIEDISKRTGYDLGKLEDILNKKYDLNMLEFKFLADCLHTSYFNFYYNKVKVEKKNKSNDTFFTIFFVIIIIVLLLYLEWQYGFIGIFKNFY